MSFETILRVLVLLVIVGVWIQIARHDYEFISCGDHVYRCNKRNGQIQSAAYKGNTFENGIGFR